MLAPNKDVNVIMYADDTVILTSDKSHQTVTEKMQSVIELLSRWCKNNKLTINTHKNQADANI